MNPLPMDGPLTRHRNRCIIEPAVCENFEFPSSFGPYNDARIHTPDTRAKRGCIYIYICLRILYTNAVTGDWRGANIFTECVDTCIYWKIFLVHLPRMRSTRIRSARRVRPPTVRLGWKTYVRTHARVIVRSDKISAMFLLEMASFFSSIHTQ